MNASGLQSGNKPATAIRLLIVDDVAQVRQDLRTVLALAGGIDIVGEAADGRAAVEQAAALRPAVVLMDLEMPELDGYAAGRQIKAANPACRLVALTVHGYQAARDRAAAAGFDAFVVKGAPLSDLVAAIAASAREE